MSRAPTVALDAFQKVHPRAYAARFLERGTRLDGRGLDEVRAARATRGALGNADGSCVATVGRTTVACGATRLVGRPAPDAPRDGAIEVRVQLPGLCAAERPETGRADALQELVARVVRACVRLDQLCVAEGAAAWCVRLDVVCLDDDGNVADAALLAALGALRDVRLPPASAVVTSPEDGLLRVVGGGGGGEGAPIALEGDPVPLTSAVFQGALLADPTVAEEAVADGSLTLVVDAGTGTVLVAHKPGGPAVSVSAVAQCAKRCAGRRVLEQQRAGSQRSPAGAA